MDILLIILIQLVEKIYPGFKHNESSYSVVDYHLRQLKKLKPNADFFTSMAYLELKQRLSELTINAS